MEGTKRDNSVGQEKKHLLLIFTLSLNEVTINWSERQADKKWKKTQDDP